jgi:hypothetical protein
LPEVIRTRLELFLQHRLLVYDDKREQRAGLSEQNHAVDRALDETRDNIMKTIDEVISLVIDKCDHY